MKQFLVVISVVVMSLVVMEGCFAVTEKQEKAIIGNCLEIKEQLKNTQKNDARTRVHLGGRYETILNRFMIPLNVRLVENNLSNAELVENQNKFAEIRKAFIDDYIDYQQELEELVAMDCENKPGDFYTKLEETRQGRKTVEQDTIKLKKLITEHVKLVTGLRDKL